MDRSGFSLVELIVVMAVAGILLTIAGMNWNTMQKKGFVENQARTLQSDLMAARLEALYTKRPRTVILSGSQFSSYSSTDTSVNPASRKSFKYPLKWKPASGTLTLTFDAGGLSTFGADLPICVDPANDLSASNPGTVDSLVITTARINLGKRGGDCDVANIAQK